MCFSLVTCAPDNNVRYGRNLILIRFTMRTTCTLSVAQKSFVILYGLNSIKVRVRPRENRKMFDLVDIHILSSSLSERQVRRKERTDNRPQRLSFKQQINARVAFSAMDGDVSLPLDVTKNILFSATPPFRSLALGSWPVRSNQTKTNRVHSRVENAVWCIAF